MYSSILSIGTLEEHIQTARARSSLSRLGQGSARELRNLKNFSFGLYAPLRRIFKSKKKKIIKVEEENVMYTKNKDDVRFQAKKSTKLDEEVKLQKCINVLND